MKKKILLLSTKNPGGPKKVMSEIYNSIKKEKGFDVDFYDNEKGFFKAMFTKKYDIIHSVLPVPFNIWNTKKILHVHGNYLIEKNIKNPATYLYPRAIKSADVVLVPSEYLKKTLNIENAQVVPNFIDYKTLNPQKKSKDKLKVITITNFEFLEKCSGILNLIKWLNQIKTQKEIEFTIIGKGRYLDKIKSESLKNPSIKINWKGYMKNPKTEIEKSDLFVYNSNLDTFSIVVIEAMERGVPVITNEYGAAKEIITNKKNGFIASTKKEFETAVYKIISDNKIEKSIIKEARKTVKQKFSRASIIKKYIKLYRSL
ncbi:MAG: glycosyltransferase family 4 protein [Candidatus Woesearchaeota archaeon]